MNYLEQVKSIPVKVLEEFVKSGRSEIIPIEVQEYINQLNTVSAIRKEEKFHNITRLAEHLMRRYPGLSIRTAKNRVYDAMAFFHVHDPISNAQWSEIYAEKMEDIAQMCIAKGKEETAVKALDLAYLYRTRDNNEIDPDKLKPPTFIISHIITAQDLGFESNNLKAIASKDNSGHYIKLIDSLDIENEDKIRLKKDAGVYIEDAQIIEQDDN